MRIDEIRTGLCTRLRARREEIEQSTLTRVYAVSDPVATADAEYMEGLKAAVGAAIEYGIAALERSEDQSPPLPTILLAQARLAAQNGIGLETVLRRYLAGYTLLGDFIIDEAGSGGLSSGASLKRLLRAQAALFDGVMAAISDEYVRERERRFRSRGQGLAEKVRRILAGELVDPSELGYDLEGWHLGAIVATPDGTKVFTDIAKDLGHRLLVVRQEGGAAWIWLGSRRGFGCEELSEIAAKPWPAELILALGEPAQGLPGWRLTHRQACAALPVAQRRRAFTRYADVALLASALQDGLLADSLHQLYLRPLERERDGGAVARQTLRAYFDSNRNASSAAAALRVSRRTVAARMQAIEERLGRPLSAGWAQIEVALSLEGLNLDQPPSVPRKTFD
jgi:hypothetical protein